ncbi:hypothetical protein [Pseudomonas sp. MWU318]|uniref:hypothetical protein n=1 Tax=Pseudomonas sp. MWU318 TaxID=2802569 RepID=UPI001928745D|nr:hypothetical protein [Pseudomonas sp. MWU318]
MSLKSDTEALKAIEEEAQRLLKLTEEKLKVEIQDGLKLIIAIATYRTNLLDPDAIRDPH